MKKKLQNFWYHYKVHSIVAAFLALIIFISVWQLATDEKYDYNVYLYLSQGITTEVQSSVETALEEYGEDINGDGEVNVGIINLSYSPYDANGENQMSYASALSGEIRLKKNFIFITDEYRFDELEKQDIFADYDFFTDKNGKAFLLKGSDLQEEIETRFVENNLSAQKVPEMLISLRENPGSDDKNYENYERDLTLVKNIISKE